MSIAAALIVLAVCVLLHGAVYSAVAWFLVRSCRNAQEDIQRRAALALPADAKPAATKEAPRQGPILVEGVAVSDNAVTTTYVCKACGNRFSNAEPRQNTPT